MEKRQYWFTLCILQGFATLENVADAVRKSGITKEELRLQDFKQVWCYYDLLLAAVYALMGSGMFIWGNFYF